MKNTFGKKIKTKQTEKEIRNHKNKEGQRKRNSYTVQQKNQINKRIKFIEHPHIKNIRPAPPEKRIPQRINAPDKIIEIIFNAVEILNRILLKNKHPRIKFPKTK